MSPPPKKQQSPQLNGPPESGGPLKKSLKGKLLDGTA